MPTTVPPPVQSAIGEAGALAPAAGRAPAPSIKPALIVVVIAVLIVVLGGVVALTSSAAPSSTPLPARGVLVPGLLVRAVPAAGLLSRIASAGQPPAGIVDSLAVPAGSLYEAKTVADRGVDQFDRSVRFSTSVPPGGVESFYKTELHLENWKLQSAGPAAGSYELLGIRDGSDGYQWGVGVVIAAVEPAISPALAGGSQTAATSQVTLTLYQVQDAS